MMKLVIREASGVTTSLPCGRGVTFSRYAAYTIRNQRQERLYEIDRSDSFDPDAYVDCISRRVPLKNISLESD